MYRFVANLLICVCLILSSTSMIYAADSANWWQLVFAYSDNSLVLQQATPIAPTGKAITTPGLGGAPVTLIYEAEWQDQFGAVVGAVGRMQQTQPNYSAKDLAQIRVPVAIVQSEHDEFIKLEHAEYLAQSIPDAEFIELPGVSHFAPLQRPAQLNRTILTFLDKVLV